MLSPIVRRLPSPRQLMADPGREPYRTAVEVGK